MTEGDGGGPQRLTSGPRQPKVERPPGDAAETGPQGLPDPGSPLTGRPAPQGLEFGHRPSVGVVFLDETLDRVGVLRGSFSDHCLPIQHAPTRARAMASVTIRV